MRVRKPEDTEGEKWQTKRRRRQPWRWRRK